MHLQKTLLFAELVPAGLRLPTCLQQESAFRRTEQLPAPLLAPTLPLVCIWQMEGRLPEALMVILASTRKN